MDKVSKDSGSPLLQKDPAREALLEKMREQLSRNYSLTYVASPPKKRAGNPNSIAITLSIILGILGLIMGVMVFSQKEMILTYLGYEAVPSLPKPDASLSADEQARYWTYALYDIQKLRKQFRVRGYYSIDAQQAKANLEALLPRVEVKTLGEISAYTPVAFRAFPSQGANP